MVAWEAICKPRELGGLGITDLKLAGFALQTRWLWLQKTDQSHAWSQLPIKTTLEVQAFFRASTYTIVGDGKTTLFWEDRWVQGTSPVDSAPNLAALVSSRIKARLTVSQGLANRHWTRGVAGGMSTDEIAEYLELWETMETVTLNHQPDKIVWQ
jgi:hypothetical protein